MLNPSASLGLLLLLLLLLLQTPSKGFKLVVVLPLHMDAPLSDSSTTAVLEHMQKCIWQVGCVLFATCHR
jgi:hypothetical protein